MTTKMVFHGSDIEKICAYYHLNKEDIVKFEQTSIHLVFLLLSKEIAENIDLFSSYPDRDYVSLREIRLLHTVRFSAEFILRKWLQRAISLAIQERAPKHVPPILTTYSEYSRELSSPEAIPGILPFSRKNEITGMYDCAK